MHFFSPKKLIAFLLDILCLFQSIRPSYFQLNLVKNWHCFRNFIVAVGQSDWKCSKVVTGVQSQHLKVRKGIDFIFDLPFQLKVSSTLQIKLKAFGKH